MSLLSAIKNGESKTIEFKEKLPKSDAVAKTVIAFSNTGGGKIIVGVNDNGGIVGLDADIDIFELQDKVASIIYDHCYPNVLPDIYTANVGDKVLLVIEVYRGNLLPYYLKKAGKNEGVYIRVGIYDDIINVVSPGAFPSTITQEDILEGRSEIRNKVIARVFKELNYIEQWGSGIRRIKSTCVARGLKEPDIVEKGDFVDVSLYREGTTINHTETEVSDLTEQEKIIIEYLRSSNRITTQEVKSILGVEERRARNILKGLVDQGILERIGKTTNTYYRPKA